MGSQHISGEISQKQNRARILMLFTEITRESRRCGPQMTPGHDLSQDIKIGVVIAGDSARLPVGQPDY